ncbi:hypothetical protein [Streptomyces abyssalis]|uniref:hypothetical protein n=1 Tax=Streptomyces abyssalis TaxID=933944 RepID=UPI00085CE018|nr:hypothetical protein [Streptomyces abyssalis]
MSQDRTLRPGARRAGAALLAGLAVLDLAWIVRDFSKATDVTDAWWMWSGLIFRAQDGIWASSFVEPTLLVLYTVCTVTVVVSSAARGILVSTGVLTILLRVPTLWNLNASWVQSGVSDGLRLKVLFSAIAMLVIAAAVIVLAVAGRRGVPPGSPGTGTTRDEAPARPTRAGGVAACVLLTLVAAVLVSWEIHSATEQGWELYSQHFTGDRALATLLAVPESWYGSALALVSLYAAGAALTRAPHSRPLGMTVSGPLLGLGLFRLSFAAKSGLLGGFGQLAARDQLWLCTAVFEILAALGVLLALAARHGDADGREPHSGTIRAFSSA